jgi:hypothetical protein
VAVLGISLGHYAAVGIEGWVVENKCWESLKVAIQVVERLLEQAKQIQDKKELEILRIWLFVYYGVAKDAKALMHQHHVLW